MQVLLNGHIHFSSYSSFCPSHPTFIYLTTVPFPSFTFVTFHTLTRWHIHLLADLCLFNKFTHGMLDRSMMTFNSLPKNVLWNIQIVLLKCKQHGLACGQTSRKKAEAFCKLVHCTVDFPSISQSITDI